MRKSSTTLLDFATRSLRVLMLVGTTQKPFPSFWMLVDPNSTIVDTELISLKYSLLEASLVSFAGILCPIFKSLQYMCYTLTQFMNDFHVLFVLELHIRRGVNSHNVNYPLIYFCSNFKCIFEDHFRSILKCIPSQFFYSCI